MRMRPVPSSQQSIAADMPLLTTTVPFGALIFDRDTRAIAEEYLYSPVVAEYLASKDTIPPVWCDRVSSNKFQVVVQDENLLNFAAAFLRDRENIPIVMLSSDISSSS